MFYFILRKKKVRKRLLLPLYLMINDVNIDHLLQIVYYTVCMFIIIKRRIKHMNYASICMLASKDGSNEDYQYQLFSI